MLCATSSDFDKPLQLLQSTPDGLVLDEETAEMVAKITQPVVVIAIAGKYRTGKSYILNLLSNLPKGSGFALGDTVVSLTKGIWVYALSHPNLADTTLILLDTEGLNDVEKGDLDFDTTLLVLTILLSSTFILNVTGRLDDDVINQLGFVSILTKSMKTKADEVETGDDFQLFFPQMAVLVRDFCLALRINGQDVTANEYFNNFCLKNKDLEGSSIALPSRKAKLKPYAEKYNEPRRLIKKYFPRRFCITLPLPVYDSRLLRNLENVPDSQLNPYFLSESADFVKMILNISEPKCITEKARVNGTILITLLRNYLEQIKDGAVPCIETTLQSTARLENEKLLSEFIVVYKEGMHEMLSLPTSMETITEIHQKLCFQFNNEFKKRIIFEDKENEMEKKYVSELNEAFQEILRENDAVATRHCEKRLEELSEILMNNLNEKVYYRSGGYSQYSADLHDVIDRYNDVEEKTVKHEEVLCQFVTDRYREGSQISALDDQLSESEKEAEAARVAKEHAEQLAKMQKEQAQQTMNMTAGLNRTLQETMTQLRSELNERSQKIQELTEQMEEMRKNSNPCVIL